LKSVWEDAEGLLTIWSLTRRGVVAEDFSGFEQRNPVKKSSARQIEYHLEEIDAWRRGDRGTPGQPSTGLNYPGAMLDAIKRHEQSLIDLGHRPTIAYVQAHGFADGQRGAYMGQQNPTDTLCNFTDVASQIGEWRRKFDTATGPGMSTLSRLPSKEIIKTILDADARLHRPILLAKPEAKKIRADMEVTLKNVGKYGGVPAKILAERIALKEILDEIVYALKTPAKQNPVGKMAMLQLLDGKTSKVKVAYEAGEFIVHSGGNKTWNVTHLPTGKLAAWGLQRDHAVALADALAGPWNDLFQAVLRQDSYADLDKLQGWIKGYAYLPPEEVPAPSPQQNPAGVPIQQTIWQKKPN
jgi:hypothetical protein